LDASSAPSLAKGDDMISSCFKPQEFTSTHKSKLCRIKVIRECRNCTFSSRLPKKKPIGGKLTAQDKADNRNLAQQRVVIERVNRCLKSFRILAERYRNRRRFGLRCNLIAALYNYERSQAA
jgi:hypothetical protein